MTWQQLTEKHQGLTLREKILVLLSGLAIICLVSFALFLEPQYVGWQQQITSTEKIQQTIARTQAQVEQLEFELSQELNSELKGEIGQLKAKHRLIRSQLHDQQLALVAKTEMAEILKSLLRENNQLNLIALRSLAPQAILLTESSMTDEPMNSSEPLLYKHSIVVDVEGGYFAIVEFLQQIEQANAKILWNSVDYTVIEYPVALVRIEVFTLSTDKEFIGVNF